MPDPVKKPLEQLFAEADLTSKDLSQAEKSNGDASALVGAVNAGTLRGADTSVPESADNVLQQETVISHGPQARPKPCCHVTADPYKTCPICLWPYCQDCASVLDNDYCHLCIPVNGAELKVEPLKDIDGQVHEGRHLTPGPTFGTLAKRISEMTEPELESHIDRYKALIKQAETSLDFRRVSLGTAQVELAERQDQRRRALRGFKVPRTNKVSVSDPSKPRQSQKANLEKMLQMVQALKALQNLKKPETKS